MGSGAGVKNARKSPYRMGWLMAMFDLPVLLESEGVMVVETPAGDGETQGTYGRAPDKNALNIELKRTFTS